jgi:threonine/homoserine/homoserine lactone efflux protein
MLNSFAVIIDPLRQEPGLAMENWGVLLPILLSDVLNPVLFTFMVYAAGTGRPVVASGAMLLGHTVAYFVGGIVIAIGLERISERLANPLTIDFVIEFIIAVVLLWLALRSRKDTGKRPDEQTPEFTPWAAFGFGAIVNIIGIPFAIPYFAVIGQFLKADLNTGGVLFALLLYNLVYALPFLMIPIMTAVMGERSKPILARVNNFMERVSAYLMPVLLGVIGLALLADAIVFFIKGESLF